MSSALRGLLEAYRAGALRNSPDDLVFCTPKGTPLNSKNLYNRELAPACDRIKQPRVSWHSFRHTHATQLAESGESLKTAQALLGHSDLETTLNTYMHVIPDVAAAGCRASRRGFVLRCSQVGKWYGRRPSQLTGFLQKSYVAVSSSFFLRHVSRYSRVFGPFCSQVVLKFSGGSGVRLRKRLAATQEKGRSPVRGRKAKWESRSTKFRQPLCGLRVSERVSAPDAKMMPISKFTNPRMNPNWPSQ